MKSVVVIPTAKRPEYLALALEYLSLVPDCPPIIISADYVDAKLREDIRYVHMMYAPLASTIVYHPEHPCLEAKWNILQALKLGYETGAKRVFLVEEDVMVYPYWKEAHDRVLDTGRFVASCGRLRPNTKKYYGKMYTNPGSCLSRELLDRVIPHINDEYFKDSGAYCEKHFGQRGFGGSSLDDGVIRACIQQMGGKVAYPEHPLCAHQGFQGYKLGFDIYQNRGTINEKIAGLRRLLATVKPSDRYCPDFEPYEP